MHQSSRYYVQCDKQDPEEMNLPEDQFSFECNTTMLYINITARPKDNVDDVSKDETPSDNEFFDYFEKLLNPTGTRKQNEYIPSHERYIPILDDPIQPSEVTDFIHKLKTAKAPD